MQQGIVQTALIVGASSGIGRELAVQLAARGWRLGLAARREAELVALRDSLPHDARSAVVDVTQPDAAMAATQALIDALGGVDLVVIAAGTGDINEALDWTIERDTIATNALGFAAVANVAAQHFLARGAGHLVGLSSIAALRGGRASPAYNASKAFVSNYLEGLAQLFAKAGKPVAVTDVQAGFVDTAMAKGDGKFWVAPVDKAARQILAAIDARRAHVYVTRRWRLVAWLLKVLPRGVYRRL